MKLHFITLATLLFGLSAAAKLSSKYLPPNYAGSSAGHAGFLQGPRTQSAAAARASNQYLAPHYQSGRQSGHHAAHYVAAASTPVASSSYGHNRAAAQIPILRQEYANDASGNYNFGFETGNGIRRDETGQFVGGWPHGSQSVSGSYSYTGDDGHVYTVNYKADGNGFQATGDHLPTPPPVPRAIQDSWAQHHSARSAHASHAGFGAHHGAASAQSPSARYLPPQQGHSSAAGYNYARKH